MYNNLLVDKQDGVALLTVQRPAQLNAINAALLVELEDALHILGTSSDVFAVVVTGAGDRAFVAGADIAAMKDMDPGQARAFAEKGQHVFAMIEALRQPVIAMIQGFALGGGCELALACDMRIASDKARFGQPEVGLGITPGFGGTQRLPRLIGSGRASRLLFSGEVIRADEALRIGLVDEVVPHDQLREVTMKVARSMAEQPSDAVQQTKRCIRCGLESGLEAGLSYESQAFGICFSTQAQKEKMTAFLNRHH